MNLDPDNYWSNAQNGAPSGVSELKAQLELVPDKGLEGVSWTIKLPGERGGYTHFGAVSRGIVNSFVSVNLHGNYSVNRLKEIVRLADGVESSNAI